MIPATPIARQLPRWQSELANAVTDPAELLRLLGLPANAALNAAAPEAFALRVPRGFVRRMRRGDPLDPLLAQVLPRAAESLPQTGFINDPLDEAAARRAPGLLHKYHGRALLIATAACAVHCRYCFRREFPYAEHQGSEGRWTEALAAIAADPTIREVILSGGDPFSLTDSRLADLSAKLAAIAHVQTLRIHTRQPIVLPSRVDGGLLGWLRDLPWPVTIVVHANHPREIDDEVARALLAMRGAGALLLNQSVLLAGINDDQTVLEELSCALQKSGVLPYYLHLLDRVRGTSHFEVSEERGRALVAGMATRLPGYLVPRLVREQAGAAAKIVLMAGLPPATAADM